MYGDTKEYENLKAVVEDFHEGSKDFCNAVVRIENPPNCGDPYGKRGTASNSESDNHRNANIHPSDRFM